MKNALIWFSLIGFFSAATAKSDYLSEISEEDYKKLQEIATFLRKRIQEADAVEEVQRSDSSQEAETQSQSSANELNPPFVYRLPTPNPEDGFPPFAAGPFDPRYYQDFGTPFRSTLGPRDDRDKRPSPDDPQETVGAEPFGDDYDAEHSFVRQVPVTNPYEEMNQNDAYFTAIVAGCSAAAVVTVVAVGFGCYRLQKNAKAAADVDYPAYGVTGPNKDVSPSSGDRRLAQSAQMYHYQHQKQQIIAMESVGNKERRSSISDAESDDENEEGEYTVYECPGLAPTGEMEVKNPLFLDDHTPAPKSAIDSAEDSQELPKKTKPGNTEARHCREDSVNCQ